MSVNLEVSIGEAFDKLSILLIKKDRFLEDKTKLCAVQKEINAIEPHLVNYSQKCKIWVDALLWINKNLWNCVDIYHRDSDKPDEVLDKPHYISICREIQRHNAARFRAKKKIEHICNSSLTEQKGHARTTAMFVGHMRSGDQITNLGIVRYLSLYYDEVHVTVLRSNESTVRYLYRDDLVQNGGAIKLLITEDHVDARNLANNCSDPNMHIFRMPMISQKYPPGWRHRFYETFYQLANVPYEARWILSHFERDYQREQNLFDVCIPQPYVSNYVFVHDKIEESQVVPCEELNNLTHLYKYHPNRDISKNATWTGVQRDYVLPEFATLLERATEIHVVDSSFFCLCQLLDLSKVRRLCVYQKSTTGKYDLRGYMHPSQKESWEIK